MGRLDNVVSQRIGDGTFISVPKRDPEPEGLTNLRNQLTDIFTNSLNYFNPNSWKQAQTITNNALTQQNNLLGQLTGENGQLAKNNSLVDEIANIARTGNIGSTLKDNLNASVNKDLKSGMGTMLNNLAARGVLNSSVASTGINKLAENAADAFNRNYLTAYQAALSGMGTALQGQQNNTSATLSALSALGAIPSQAYESIGAGLMPAFNWFDNWQKAYLSDDPYNDIYKPDPVQQDSWSCITGDTLVTLEDGKQIPVAELKDDDRIQVWDFEKGQLASVPLTGFFKGTRPEGFDVFRVEFEDGSNVGVIVEHLFFDLTIGKFVAVNANSQDFVGHKFAKVVEGNVVPVKVTAIYHDGKATESYGPQAEGSWNFLTGGVISGNDGQLAFCNMFDFDTEAMRWKGKAEDLAKFGLLSYDVFNGAISKRTFDSNHFDECSVAFGKGLAQCADFVSYITHFAGYFFRKDDE